MDVRLLSKHLRPITSLESERERPSAAVAIVLNPNREEGAVLLIKRKERIGDPWSGQIAFPGGHMSKNDQSALQTAIREAWEEVGIRLSETEAVGCLKPMYSRTRMVLVAPFVFLITHDSVVSPNDEVSESFWVPLEVLATLSATKQQVKDEGRNLTVDSYVYEGRVIWGLTFRIINELLDRRTK